MLSSQVSERPMAEKDVFRVERYSSRSTECFLKLRIFKWNNEKQLELEESENRSLNCLLVKFFSWEETKRSR